jgi:hypothetical protein
MRARRVERRREFGKGNGKRKPNTRGGNPKSGSVCHLAEELRR